MRFDPKLIWKFIKGIRFEKLEINEINIMKLYLPILNFPDLITNASLAVTFDSAVWAVVAALAFELI